MDHRACPSVSTLRAAGEAAGLDAVGVAPAEPFHGTRPHLEARKAAGPPRRHAVHLPAARALHRSPPHPAGRALPRGRGPPLPGAGGRDPGPPPRPASPAYADRGPLRRAPGRPRRGRRRARRGRLRHPHPGGRQRPRRPRGRLPRRSGLVRQELEPAAARAGELVRARLGPHRRRPRDRRRAGGRRVRVVHPCIDGCPTGAIVAPGVVDARRCLAWLVQAPGVFPVEHRAALGDRIYGCDTCQEVCPPNRRSRRAGPTGAGGAGASVPVLDLLRASDEELLARHGRWYIPGRDPDHLRRNALVVLGNIGDGRDPDVVAVLVRAPAPPEPPAAGARGVGGPAARSRRPARIRCGHEPMRPRCAGGARPMKHLLVTNDFPPKLGGIQTYLWELWRRLPPDETTVLTTPHDGAEAWDRASRSGSCAAASGCSCRPAPCAARSTRLADEVGAELVLLDPALPLGAARAEPRPALRARAPRRRGHGARPGAARPAARCAARSSAPGSSSPPAATRPTRPSWRPGAGLPVVVVPPGVDHTRFTPLDAAAAARRPGPVRPARRRAGRRRGEPPRAAQGLRHGDPRRRRGSAPTHPDLLVAITGGGPRPRPARAAGPADRRAGPLPRSGVRRRPARRRTAAPTCSPWCAATAGSGSSRRGSASSSSRPRPAASRRSPDAAAAPTRPWSTATTGLVVDPHDEVAVAGALARLIDDPEARRAMARGRAAAGPRRALLRPPRRATCAHALDSV